MRKFNRCMGIFYNMLQKRSNNRFVAVLLIRNTEKFK